MPGLRLRPGPGALPGRPAGGSRGRRRLVAGTFAVLLLAGAGGWLTLRDDPGTDAGSPARAAASDAAATPDPSSAPAPPLTDGATPTDGAAPTDGASSAVLAADGLPPTLAPVALDRPRDYGDGVRARLVGIEAVDVRASGVGEVSGPAVAVTVELTNATSDAVPLDTVAVNLYSGTAALPAAPLQQETAAPFHGGLPADGSARAVYLFAVPLELRDLVTVTVGHTPASGTAVFAGSLR